MPKDNKHIYYQEGFCVGEVLSGCVPEIEANVDDKVLMAKYKQAERWVEQCIDGWILDKVSCWLYEDRELKDWECEILDHLRLAMGYYIAYLLAKVPAVITPMGDLEGVGEKFRHTDAVSHNRNMYALCDCAYDGLESLIYQGLIPYWDKLSDKDIASSSIYKICSGVVGSVAEFEEHELFAKGGKFRHFLAIRLYLGKARKELEACVCPPFLDHLSLVCCGIRLGLDHSEVDYSEIIACIRGYLVTSALRFACVRGVLRYSGDGLVIASSKQTASADSVKKLMDGITEELSRYEGNIVDYLEAHKHDVGFELYLECDKEEPSPACETKACNRLGCACGCEGGSKNNSVWI